MTWKTFFVFEQNVAEPSCRTQIESSKPDQSLSPSLGSRTRAREPGLDFLHPVLLLTIELTLNIKNPGLSV